MPTGRERRWFRRLLRLLPHGLRHRHRRDLEATFDDLRADWARRHPGRASAGARFWLALVYDATSVAVAERFDAARLRWSLRAWTQRPGRLGLASETHLAWRRIVHRPGAALASIAALACGIAGAAATWTLLNAVLLNPLGVESPDRLVHLNVRVATSRGSQTGFTFREYLALRDVLDASSAVDGLAAGGAWSFPVRVGPEARGAVSRDVQSVYFASHDYFDTLGVQPASGRGFTPEDDRRGAVPTAVLADRLWRRSFAADPAAVGSTIAVNGVETLVIGVAPRRFRGLDLTEAPDLYMTIGVSGAIGAAGNFPVNLYGDPDHIASPTAWVNISARLPDSVTMNQADTRLDATGLPNGLWDQAEYEMVSALSEAVPSTARDGMTRFARLLIATVALLLAIAASTVAMLLLTRSDARRDELALRLALGGTRTRLVAGVVMEGALLAAAGALAAVPLTWMLLDGVRGFELPGSIAIDLLELSVDPVTLLVIVGASMAAAMAMGIVAGAVGLSADVGNVLRSRAGASSPLPRRRARATLVSLQVAVAVVLLAGFGLFARSLVAALTLNPGYETDRIVTGRVSLFEQRYTDAQLAAFDTELPERLTSSLAIRSAAVTSRVVGGSTWNIDGEPRRFAATTWLDYVDDRYFETLGLSVLAGRNFRSSDHQADAPGVAIVSESFASTLGPVRDVLGRRITERTRPTMEIIGVVPDLVTSVRVMRPPAIYAPLAQRTGGSTREIALRAERGHDIAAAVREANAALAAQDPTILPPAFRTLAERLLDQMAPQRFGATVLGALGAIATLMTMFGVYVLADAMTAARRREMGIRAALGARRRQIGGLFLRDTARLVGFGVAVGLTLAWIGSSTIEALLFQVAPLDVATLASVCLVIVGLSLLVVALPAVRLARTDLPRVLRDE